MASVAEPAFLSEQAKKEEKNRKREAKNRAIEEEKRRKKEEEERQKREKELQAIANFRNNGQSNMQAPRIPAKPAVALAKPQPQAMKAPVKAAQAPLPVVAPAKTMVPTSTTHASSVQSAPVAWKKVVPKSTTNVAPANATVPSLPIASGKPLTDASKVSNLNQYQQEPATTRSTEMTFFVGQIPVNSTGKANIMFGRKETKTTTVVKTQAPVVETQASTVVEKTQTTTVVMNYASALQNKDAEPQKTLGTYNVAAATSVSVTTSVTTTLPVVPQTNQPAKAVVPQTNQPAKAVVSQTNQPSKAAVPQTNQPSKAAVPQTNQPAKANTFSATKTTNSQKGPVKSYYNGTQNGPHQKNNGNGRVTNGSGKGSSQKYHGNGTDQSYNANGSGHANGYGQRYNGNNNGQRYNGYGNGQRYYGNGRFTNGRQENQKKQPKPEPVIDEDGFQLVVNRRRPGKIHVTE